jgi:hypothetical protein
MLEAVYGINCEVARYFFMKEVAMTFPYGFGKLDITFFFIGYRPALHAMLLLPTRRPHKNFPDQRGGGTCDYQASAS